MRTKVAQWNSNILHLLKFLRNGLFEITCSADDVLIAGAR